MTARSRKLRNEMFHEIRIIELIRVRWAERVATAMHTYFGAEI